MLALLCVIVDQSSLFRSGLGKNSPSMQNYCYYLLIIYSYFSFLFIILFVFDLTNDHFDGHPVVTVFIVQLHRDSCTGKFEFK